MGEKQAKNRAKQVLNGPSAESVRSENAPSAVAKYPATPIVLQKRGWIGGGLGRHRRCIWMCLGDSPWMWAGGTRCYGLAMVLAMNMPPDNVATSLQPCWRRIRVA